MNKKIFFILGALVFFSSFFVSTAVTKATSGGGTGGGASVFQNGSEYYQMDIGSPQVLSDASKVNISVKISNPTDGFYYQIGIGNTTDNGATCNSIAVGSQFNPVYTGNTTGIKNTTDSTGKVISSVITDTFPRSGTLAVGTYCTYLNATKKIGDPLVIALASFGTTGVFTIGNPNPTQPTGANPTAPNAYGCTSSGTDTYCMLAPLPIPDASGNVNTTGLINVKQGMSAYILGLITLFMGIIGVLAVLMIVVGGIEYMSTVSIGEKEGAKDRIINALLGLLLALGSYTILKTINPNLVDLNVSISKVELPILSDTPGDDGLGINTVNGKATVVNNAGDTIDSGDTSKWSYVNITDLDPNMVIFQVTTGVTRIQMANAVIPSLKKVFADYKTSAGFDPNYKIVSIWGAAIKTITGQNTQSLSAHAFGLAVDINPATNPQHNTKGGDIPQGLKDAFKSNGWGWGGNFRSGKEDPMHFSKLQSEGNASGSDSYKCVNKCVPS